MSIDFAPLFNREVGLLEYSRQFSIDDIRATSNQLLDTLTDIINQASDEQIVFLPTDPDADDPYAVEGEEKIGWSLGHLVLHVTASSEEGFSRSSVLARGIVIPSSIRLRYEDSWHTHCRTQAECLQRLEESRRMRNAYLDTWPKSPHLDVLVDSKPGDFMHGEVNAQSSAILGLVHEAGHIEQFKEALRQAQAAHPSAG